MMSLRRLSILTVTALLVTGVSGVSTVFGDSSTSVNYVTANLTPITTTISYNYDFLTGTLSPGTAVATSLVISNTFQTHVQDPTPPDNRHGATFFGTAEPEHVCTPSGCDTVVFEQSTCPTGYPTCFSDGTFTFGGFVTRNLKGDTLDQLTNLATMWYVQTGCDGGGSPRFQIDMSGGNNIFVYLGTPPNYATDCAPGASTWMSTGNLATDPPGPGGTRWDSTQIGGAFYGTYSQAVALANAQGLTILSISMISDGGWSGTNAGNSNGQTLLFRSLQFNDVTRFP